MSKPLSTSNGFGVQLTETVSTAKWFWNKSGCNNESMFFVVYFNVYQVFVQMFE